MAMSRHGKIWLTLIGPLTHQFTWCEFVVDIADPVASSKVIPCPTKPKHAGAARADYRRV